jgi:hypothetical protein
VRGDWQRHGATGGASANNEDESTDDGVREGRADEQCPYGIDRSGRGEGMLDEEKGGGVYGYADDGNTVVKKAPLYHARPHWDGIAMDRPGKAITQQKVQVGWIKGKLKRWPTTKAAKRVGRL